MHSGVNTTAARLAALLCLLTLLFVTVPCATAQPSRTACADCCHPDHALAAPALCCAVHTQPAELPVREAGMNPAMLVERQVGELVAQCQAERLPRLQASGVSPPPLLHPILRI